MAPSTQLFTVAENSLKVGTLNCSDPEGGTVRWLLLDGQLSPLFRLNEHTGVLTFQSNPDFEAPAAGSVVTSGSVQYLLQAQCLDSSDTRSNVVAVTVTVTDVAECGDGKTQHLEFCDDGNNQKRKDPYHNRRRFLNVCRTLPLVQFLLHNS